MYRFQLSVAITAPLTETIFKDSSVFIWFTEISPLVVFNSIESHFHFSTKMVPEIVFKYKWSVLHVSTVTLALTKFPFNC